MSTLELTSNVQFWPRQKRRSSEKTPAFFKECAEMGISLANSSDLIQTSSGVRSSKRDKIIAEDLYNDKVDKREIEKTLNPLGMFNTTEFPASYRNYPLLNPSINLLCGEERKRTFTPIVTVINADAITSKVEAKKNAFFQWYIEQLEMTSGSEEEAERRIMEFSKYMNYTWKDLRERMGTQMLQYLYHTQDLKEEFSRGFKDALIMGEEIYIIEIYGGEPRLRKVDPKNISTVRSGKSWKIEDSDIIIEDSYLSIGETIDRYYDYLTADQIRTIEEGYSSTGGGVRKGRFLRPELTLPDNQHPAYIELTNMGTADMDKWVSHLSGAYDEEGNVRVTRVVWSGLRLIKIKYLFDEDGNLTKEVLPEEYKEDKNAGEVVEERWIKEWYECTKIGADTYVKMQPCEIQMRCRDNLSMSSPGIVGSIYQTGDGCGKGIIGLGKNWQYLWNTFMYRTELAFTKDRGRVGYLPLHLLPSNWEPEAAMFWAEHLGWLPVDAFNQGQEGYAKGKLAGGMSGTPTEINLSNADQVKNNVDFLRFIKEEVDSLTGITPQRRGSIDNRESVGGVERSVTQSSHITEEWFSIHDNTKVRALRALLEAAKIAYSDQSFTKEYVLDDGTKGVLEYDYEKYVEASYGVDCSNSSDDMQTLQSLKALTERYLASGGSFSIAAELIRTKDAASIVRKIQNHEDEMMKQQQQAAEAEKEAEAELLAQEQEIEMMKLQIEQEEAQLEREYNIWKTEQDNMTRITVAEINAYKFQEDLDQNNNGVPDVMEISASAREDRALDADIFSKQIEQVRKDKEVEYKKQAEEKKAKLEEKKLALEERKLEVQKQLQKMKDSEAMKREKLKARTALKNPVPGEGKK